MVRLREIPRTAAFAWSPDAAKPLIASGTKAGAVDADFSNETTLDLWDLGFGSTTATLELQPVGSTSVDSRFHDIAWGKPSDDHPHGIIAGGLESGALDLWDAEKLQISPSNARICRVEKHTGAIKALQFNPFRQELLATAGAKGELYIADANAALSASRLGTSAARADDFEAVDWNKKVAHILVTGSSGGFATVWDVKQKKESLTLNNHGRKPVSAIAWDPNVPTKLATATSNDQDPLILMWDLRNSNAPEKVLKLHDQGILSMSWCEQDPKLLLSCGKDNRTICWNTITGEALGEFPIVTNWTFQTRWNSHSPGLLATASFDGKIAVHNVQSTNVDSVKAAAVTPVLDGADFFASAQSRPQAAGFSLPIAPKWLERPLGATFGFGGKLVRFGLTQPNGRESQINLSKFVPDPATAEASEKFENVLQGGDYGSFCESKIVESKSEEDKADWTVIETLIDGSRTKLIEHLGFSKEELEDKNDNRGINGNTTTDDEVGFFESADGEDNFLSQLASTKGVKTNNPFHIYTGEETDTDRQITQALMLGAFERGLEICLKENRMSDAFMIAICGGQKCIDKAQAAYFKRKGAGPNYLRLIASVVGKNLWDIVYNADLSNWKEVMATLCTFADENEFPDLCEALGDRLEESLPEASAARKDASFCYLAGSKLEKVVVNWTKELEESEQEELKQGNGDSTFSIHVKALQDFIEKVTVFRHVTQFKDADRSKSDDWRLAPLYAKYAEYADILASQGRLSIAMRYLDLLPPQYPAAEVARNRIEEASKKAAPVQEKATTASATQVTSRAQRVVPSYPQQVSAPTSVVPAPSSFAPAGAQTVASSQLPYAPTGVRSNYTPSGYQPSQQGYQQPGYGGATASSFAGSYQPTGYGNQQSYGSQTVPPPPPRASTSSPSVPAPSKDKNLSAWNDTPDFGPTQRPSRRATPVVLQQPLSSQLPNQGVPLAPPPAVGTPYSSQQRATPPLPPPPKAGAARVSSPSQSVQPQEQRRPSSSAANTYSPVPPQSGFPPALQSTIPRGSSPYNPPPGAAPPSSRYAPTPGSQPGSAQSAYGGPLQRQIAPQPSGPYAPPTAANYGQPSATIPAAAPAPPPKAQPPPPSTVALPPMGSAKGMLSGTGGLPQPERPTSQGSASTKAPASAQKYPAGDRSHIPAASRAVYTILSGEMQRVKSKAPPSFRQQVLDTEKRLNILFDHLNNEDLLKPDTVNEMNDLARAIETRRHDEAQALLTDIMTNKTDEGSNWMVGVKRLIQMSRATPL